MIHLRQPYTPDIFVSRPLRVVAVGAVEYEAVPEPSSFSLVGALPGVAEGEKSAPTQGEKIAAALYLLPFLAGPPAVGWLLFGTLGAVGGAILAAPAIYMYGAALAGK